MPPSLNVPKNLNLSCCVSLNKLPEGLSVGGGLNLFGCIDLEKFPKYLTVSSFLNISHANLLIEKNTRKQISSILKITRVKQIEAINVLAFRPSDIPVYWNVDFGPHLKTMKETIKTANTELIDLGRGRLQERRMEILCDQVLNALKKKRPLSDKRFQLVPQLLHQYKLLGKEDAKIEKLRKDYGAALSQIPGFSDLANALGYTQDEYTELLKDYHIFFKWHPVVQLTLEGYVVLCGPILSKAKKNLPKQIISVSDAYYTHLINPGVKRDPPLEDHQKTLVNSVMIYKKNQDARLAEDITDIKDIPLLYRANRSTLINKILIQYFGLFSL